MIKQTSYSIDSKITYYNLDINSTSYKEHFNIFKNTIIRHSFDDSPSVVIKTGTLKNPKYSKYWHKDGKLHRLTGPSIIYSDLNEEYYIDGELIGYSPEINVNNFYIYVEKFKLINLLS